MPKEHEELVREADDARSRLVETLSVLDHRRHELMDIHLQFERHKTIVIGAAGAVVVGVGTVIGVSIWHASYVRRHLGEQRWKALRRFWFHPERLAPKEPPQGSLVQRLGTSVLLSTLTFLATTLTKRAVHRLLYARGEEPKTGLGAKLISTAAAPTSPG